MKVRTHFNPLFSFIRKNVVARFVDIFFSIGLFAAQKQIELGTLGGG